VGQPAFVGAPFVAPPTSLSFALMERVEVELRRLGWELVAFHGFLSSRLVFLFWSWVRSDFPLLVYAGHGLRDALVGDDPLFNFVTVNEVDRFRGKIVVSLPSCYTADILGRRMVAAGCRAYVGSTYDMYAAWDEAENLYFQNWMDYMLAFYIPLLRGKTVGEALESYRRKATEYIRLYEAHVDVWKMAQWYIYSTLINRDYVVVLGDPDARLPAPASASLAVVPPVGSRWHTR